jgi:hypothetical protein
MAATGAGKATVWRLRERFMTEGVDRLLREKARPPGTPSVPDERAVRVVAMRLKPPPALGSRPSRAPSPS